MAMNTTSATKTPEF